MKKCAVSSPCCSYQRLISCVYKLLVAVAIVFAFSGRAAVADGGGLVDGRPSSNVEIFRWDPDSNRWIDCSIQRTHVICRATGTLPVPIASILVPVDVSVGFECSPQGFSVTGSAELPVYCSVNSPCLINGVGVRCAQEGDQITCEFFVNENGSWVSRGTRVIDIGAVVNVFIDCTGELITRVVDYVRDHGTVSATLGIPNDSFTPGNGEPPATSGVFVGLTWSFGPNGSRR